MHGNHGRRTWTAVLLICAVMVAAIGALAAAWRISHPPGGRHHTALRHQTASEQPTVLPRASCGELGTRTIYTTGTQMDSTQMSWATPGALACFGMAARECKAASIDVGDGMGVDTGGTAHEFIIEPGGAPCRVTELTQDSNYSVSLGGTPGPVSSTPCRVASVTGSGVTIVCGDEYTLIPAKVAPLHMDRPIRPGPR